MAFTTILIANRGEIACRVARSVRALGYRVAAVYSEADAAALHVQIADAAACIGPPPSRDSYLNIPAVIAAARALGADAIHPGYGFLSENAEFAAACAAAGIVFIGPPAAAIAAIGNKAAAKRTMEAAGVPVIPGYHGADQSDAALAAAAQRCGFPVMIKAAAGGGGRGLRRVNAAGEVAAALSVARSESLASFGSDELIVEKVVAEARHVEVQVFADSHGNIIHLGERDCSAQRRFQKVIEEAPSPAVSADLRQRMGAAAVTVARTVGYVGAGTVEFLLDAAGAFYFLEMNTRLQVEHPVTEAITGLDLVAWQIKVAAGEKLPLDQAEVAWRGHAIEARLYAEDPAAGFLPQSGPIAAWQPASGEGIRVDHGLHRRDQVSPWYDAMLAKVIAWGETREIARRRLARALDDTVLLGVANNRRFLLALLNHGEFIAGRANTGFIPRFFPDGQAVQAAGARRLALGALLWFERSRGACQPGLANWRSTGPATWPLKLAVGDAQFAATLACGDGGRYSVAVAGGQVELLVVERGETALRYVADGAPGTAHYAFADDLLFLDDAGVAVTVAETLFQPSALAAGKADSEIRAPMDGKIVAVLAKAGEAVGKGQRLVVMEAMKMQHELVCRGPATVDRVLIREGDQVAIRQLLVALVPAVAAPDG
jgi:geranyl-CoA carboxylase alpha subunit